MTFSEAWSRDDLWVRALIVVGLFWLVVELVRAAEVNGGSEFAQDMLSLIIAFIPLAIIFPIIMWSQNSWRGWK